MEAEQPLVLVTRGSLRAGHSYNRRMDETARHLRLLTETIAAVNSTLDLEEVLALVAREVAEALGADACFVYLYDERADELVLRATHGTRVEEMTRRPRMRPGEGITGAAAAAREPVMLPAQAHLDPRFKAFPNLPEDEYESILAVPILAREKLEGALNVRTREPREFTRRRDRPAARDRGAGRAVDRAREALRAGAAAGRRARGAREDLGGGLRVALPRGVARGDRQDDDGRAVDATGAALVLEDGAIAWPEGRAGAHAVRMPLRWKRPRRSASSCRPRHAVHATTTARCSPRSRTTRRSRSSTAAR